MWNAPWYRTLRLTVVFFLGVAVIVDAVAMGRPAGELVVGLVMVGVLPLDQLVDAIRRRNGKEGP